MQRSTNLHVLFTIDENKTAKAEPVTSSSMVLLKKKLKNEADNAESEKNYAKTLFEVVKATVTIKRVARIGLRADSKNLPIKVSLANEKEKSLVLRSLVALKNNKDYTGMSISEDLTIAERKVPKEWVDKAKSRNQGLPTNSNSIWRVRGDSKNGYRLKEFTTPK